MGKEQKFDKEKPYAILCEGFDEYRFLCTYLDYLEQTEKSFQDCHHVMDLGGVNDFPKALRTIPLIPNYEYVKGILLVLDAETNAINAIASLIDHIKRTWHIQLDPTGNIQVNENEIKIGFFLFPGMDEEGSFRNGTLEDLCWEIIQVPKEDISIPDLKQQTEAHLCKIIEMHGKMKKYHKNKLHVLLSSTDSFVDQKIGEAAKAKAFDFSSEKLTRLREMILQMQDNERQLLKG